MSAQYTHLWDTGLLEWASIEPGDLPGVSTANFGLVDDQLDAGQLTFAWFDPQVQGVSLPEDVTLYQICFNVIGSAGQYAGLHFGGAPVPVELINGNLQDIDRYGLLGSSVAIAAPSAPLVIEAGCVEGGPCGGDTPAIAIDVQGGAPPFLYTWSGPNGYSASSEDLLFVLPGTYSLTVTDVSGSEVQALFSVPDGGNFTVDAVVVQPGCNGSTGSIDLQLPPELAPYTFAWNTLETTEDIGGLPPGTYSVTITSGQGCAATQTFELSAEELIVGITYLCNVFADSTQVEISSLVWGGGQPPYIFQWSNGETDTSDLFASTVVALPGVFGVTVTDQTGCQFVDDQIIPLCGNTQMLTAYSYECLFENNTWTANVSVAVWDGGVPPYTFMWSTGEMTTGDFVSTITGPGNQTYGVTIVDALGNAYIPELADPDCGNPGGTDLNLRFETPVNVIPPEGIVCLDIVADNFEDMVSAQFSVEWDPTAFDFDHVESADLPSVSASNFGDNPFWLSQGKLGFYWYSLLNTADLDYTLPNGGALFRLCLRARSDAAGDTSEVIFNNMPTPFEFIGPGDNAVPFGYSSQVLIVDESPMGESVTLQAGDKLVAAGDNICVPVSALIFNDILSLQFSMVWDTSLAHFTGIELLDLPGISINNFGLTQADEGRLSFAWFDPDLSGETLPVGAGLFRVCFDAGNTPGTSPFAFSQLPTPFEAYNTNDEFVPFVGLAGSITVADLIVWPGNANDNALVNHFDLLPIGLAYGAAGPQRPNANLSWAAQGAPGWQQATPNSLINYAFIDTDGNGVIDASDTLALAQNWGLQPTAGLLAEQDKQLPAVANTLGTTIYVKPDTLALGQPATLQIMLGDIDNPALDVYGLAFSIIYDPDAVVAGSVYATFAESWLRQPGGDLIAVAREDNGNHRIDIAISRIDGLNTSGNGPVGQLHLTIEDVIFMRQDNYEMSFSIENVQLINASEEEILLVPATTTSVIGTVTSAYQPELDQQIKVFPSPTSDKLWIQANGTEVQQVILYNSSGQVFERWNQPASVLALGRLPAGLYRLAVITDKGVVRKSVVKH